MKLQETVQEPKLVQYVGKKPEKKDTVTGSNLYWPGPGSILQVEYTRAVQLLRHPKVWIEVDEKGKTVGGSKPIMPKASEPKKDEGDEDGDEGDTSDDGEEVAVEAVKDAIRQLDRENPEHFSDKGKPKLKAVQEALGTEVSVKVLNAAWKEIDG